MEVYRLEDPKNLQRVFHLLGISPNNILLVKLSSLIRLGIRIQFS